jgi:hypothetical protein
MKSTAILALLVCSLLSACATTNFATSPSPATIQEQWTRQGITLWGGPRLFRVGNVEMGLDHPSGKTYTVDSGATVMRVWYYGNRNGFKGMFTQTDFVEIPVVLAPNGHYELTAWAAPEAKTIQFSLMDLTSGQQVASTADIPLVVGASRLRPQGAAYIPVYIPARR